MNQYEHGTNTMIDTTNFERGDAEADIGLAPNGNGGHPDAVGNRVVTVGILNDYEVVVRGVAAMLAPYENRVRVVELDAGGQPTTPADVALFDTFAGRRHTLSRAAEMVREGAARHVVLYTWDAAPAFVRAARDLGVSGVILKTRLGRHAGRRDRSGCRRRAGRRRDRTARDGRRHGGRGISSDR